MGPEQVRAYAGRRDVIPRAHSEPLTAFCGKMLYDVDVGYAYTAALTDDGTLFVWGCVADQGDGACLRRSNIPLVFADGLLGSADPAHLCGGAPPARRHAGRRGDRIRCEHVRPARCRLLAARHHGRPRARSQPHDAEASRRRPRVRGLPALRWRRLRGLLRRHLARRGLFVGARAARPRGRQRRDRDERVAADEDRARVHDSVGVGGRDVLARRHDRRCAALVGSARQYELRRHRDAAGGARLEGIRVRQASAGLYHSRL